MDFEVGSEGFGLNHGSPQPVRARLAKVLLHIGYLLGMIFIIAMLVAHIARIKKSEDKTYTGNNALDLDSSL